MATATDPVPRAGADATPSSVASSADAAGHGPTTGSNGDERAPVEIVVLALLAVVAGLVLRFVARTPFWLDEALSANIAALDLGEIPDALRRDGHPPLYYLLLHGWMQVVGTGDVAVRALSGVIAVATLPLAWIAGRRRGGPLLGWLAVAVLALSPYAQRYATETRMYSLVILLVFAGYLLLDDVLRSGRGGWRYPVLGVVAGLLLLSHYWAIWLLGATGLLMIGVAVRRRGEPVARAAWSAVVAIVVGAVVLFGWWVPTLLAQASSTGTPWAPALRPSVVLSILIVDFGSATGAVAESPLLAVVAVVLAALGLFGRRVGQKHIELDLGTNPQVRWEAVVLIGTVGLGIVAGYASSSAFAGRYGAVVFPLFVLLVSAGISRFGSRPLRAGVLGAALALSLVGSLYGAVVFQRSQARELAEAIELHAAPGDLVVVCPDQLGPSLAREVAATETPGVDVLSYPRLAPAEFVDWVDYAERLAEVDPEQVGREIVERAGPDASIFVVWAGSYRTHEDVCEALVGAISAERGPGLYAVSDSGERFYEHANLNWFPRSDPTG